MPTHRNNRLDIFGDGAEVEKLYNDRWRVTVRCLPQDKVKDWFYENRGNTFANFASSMDAEIKIDGASQGWGAPDGQPWADAKLISQSLGYTPSGEYVVTFTYETLPTEYLQDRSEEVDYELNGLRRVTRTLIAEEGSDYGKVVGSDSIEHTALGYGTETLYLATVNELPKPESEGGYTRIQEVWLEPGVLRQSERLNDDGTKEVTTTSWFTKPTPSGIVTNTIQENVEGFNVWTVGAVQSLDGGDPTSGTALVYEAYVPFTYPGIAEAVREDIAARPAVNTRLKAPIQADVLATVSISYSDSGDVGTLPETYWNPTEWAFMSANWLTARGGNINEPTSRYQALVGYRTGPEDEQTLVGGGGVQQAFFNQFCYGGTVTISGGPEDPVGNSYVISRPNPEPAFVGDDGTQYYRQTIVTATIPAQT